MCLTGVIIALAAAERSIGAVCAVMVLYNMGQQCTQVASSYRIAGLNPKARARTNGCILLFVFIGQVRVNRKPRPMLRGQGTNL